MPAVIPIDYLVATATAANDNLTEALMTKEQAKIAVDAAFDVQALVRDALCNVVLDAYLASDLDITPELYSAMEWEWTEGGPLTTILLERGLMEHLPPEDAPDCEAGRCEACGDVLHTQEIVPSELGKEVNIQGLLYLFDNFVMPEVSAP